MRRPWPFSECWNEATRSPVRMSNAKMFCALTSCELPAAVPGGRALVKLPVA